MSPAPFYPPDLSPDAALERGKIPTKSMRATGEICDDPAFIRATGGIQFPKDEALDDTAPVHIVLRRFEHEHGCPVIALFPFIGWSVTQDSDECMSYMHTGQHGAADYQNCIDLTAPANAQDGEEAEQLVEELRTRGYSLIVITNEQACYLAGRKSRREA